MAADATFYIIGIFSRIVSYGDMEKPSNSEVCPQSSRFFPPSLAVMLTDFAKRWTNINLMIAEGWPLASYDRPNGVTICPACPMLDLIKFQMLSVCVMCVN